MCYAGPVVGAIVSTFAWSKNRSSKLWWLTLLFWGGAIFGFVDHLWNGELFLISKDIGKDLLLGVVISALILVAWAITVALSKVNPTLAKYVEANR